MHKAVHPIDPRILECMLAEVLGPCPHPSTLALIKFVQGEEWLRTEPFYPAQEGGRSYKQAPTPPARTTLKQQQQ